MAAQAVSCRMRDRLPGEITCRASPGRDFSRTGNSRPQWGQITVSPGFHSFAAFSWRRTRKRGTGRRAAGATVWRIVSSRGLPAPFFPRGTFRGAAQPAYYNRRWFHEAEKGGCDGKPGTAGVRRGTGPRGRRDPPEKLRASADDPLQGRDQPGDRRGPRIGRVHPRADPGTVPGPRVAVGGEPRAAFPVAVPVDRRSPRRNHELRARLPVLLRLRGRGA